MSNNNAEVLETIKKFGLLNYLQSLIKTNIKKIELYPVFPYTAATNLSEKKQIIIIEDMTALIPIILNPKSVN